jgi:hypothetical protein
MQVRLTTDSGSLSSPIPEDSMLRTPSAIEGEGGAMSEAQARERNRMVQVRDQMAQLAAENGLKVSASIAESLLPTPAVGHIRNHDEPIEDYMARRQKMEDGEYKGMPGVSLGVAVRMEMLPTVKARDSNPEGYEAGLRRGMPQLGTMVKAIVDGDDRLDLLPTPNTMEHREIKTPEQIAEMKAKSPGGYRNLRESVINELLPTPIVRDYKDGSAAQERDGKVSTDTVARAIFNSGEVSEISWGKFEPAIRRWEQVLGRPAPAPTKPDGKDGNHRLAAEFTEWMMGLDAGHVTNPELGLSRVEMLKLCGNGVVPQQAQLALEILLEGIEW